MNFRRWILPRLDKEAAASLAEEAGLEPFLALMLSLRGMTDVEEALEFLSGWDVTADPLAFADMDKAAARVRRALDQGERIMVYGDYDADGVTSTCCTRICGNREPTSCICFPNGRGRVTACINPRWIRSPRRA